jgi:hypothetical protein
VTVPDPNYLFGLRKDQAALDAIREAIKGKRRVILHLHGGLSAPDDVTKDLGPQLLEHLFQPRWFADTHVCFVIYETSPFQLLNIKRIFRNIVSDATQGELLEWLSGKLGGEKSSERDIAARASAELERLAQLAGSSGGNLKSVADGELTAEDETRLAEVLHETDTLIAQCDADLLANATRAQVAVAGPKGLGSGWGLEAAKAVVRTLKRFHKHIDHGPTTIVEELMRCDLLLAAGLDSVAQGHWDSVKENARDCWIEGSDGFALLKLLADEARSRGPDAPLSVSLMCHSAGSLAVCEAVSALDRVRRMYPTFGFDALVFVAPAVQTKLFHDAIITRLGDGYGSVWLYTLSDFAETKDDLLGGVYPRSLLYLVSGVAEAKGGGDMMLLGLERHFVDGRWPYSDAGFEARNKGTFGPLRAIREFIGDEKKLNLVISPTPRSETRPGRCADATTHENSKLVLESPVLAASLVHTLTAGVHAPTADQILHPAP